MSLFLGWQVLVSRGHCHVPGLEHAQQGVGKQRLSSEIMDNEGPKRTSGRSGCGEEPPDGRKL